MTAAKRSLGIPFWSRLLGLTALAVALGSSLPVMAFVAPGGGSRTRDCYTVFESSPNSPSFRPKNFRCKDGDPSCDADGTENGVCEFAVAVCGNSTALPACTPGNLIETRVEHALDNGDPAFDPDFQALQQKIDNQLSLPTSTTDVCTTTSSIFVKLKGPAPGNRCSRRTKILRLTSRASTGSGSSTDTDTMRLTCLPAQSTCLPQVLFDGTFDRIQQQIFNDSCALSGCHDSQTKAGDLLLEEGASYANLANAVPMNTDAQNLGWKRMTLLGPTSGDPNTSLLFHKVDGSLGGGNLGSRMPFGRPPLNGNLIEIIRLWILAGAPTIGWVPGTDN